jgi:hypothetical protein
MEEPNNDIDAETLQAQIDLSMAYTQNLVASWLALPSSSSLNQSLPSSSRAAEKEVELQALLRRPPRCVNFPQFESLAKHPFKLFPAFSWALGWAWAHRSLKRLLPRRRVSCRN